jgi:hypothetical protein
MEDPKVESLVKQWSELYMGEVLEFAKPKDVSNEEVFGDVYHSLIHSSIADTLVRLEHSNAMVRFLYQKYDNSNVYIWAPFEYNGSER